MAQKDATQGNMAQVNAASHAAVYTAQDRWLKMPMAEYLAGYRDFARVRGYCRECGRYGNCWACPPYDFDETALLEQYTTISLLATVITPSEGVALTPETADRIIRRERQRLDRMLLGMEQDIEAQAERTTLRNPQTAMSGGAPLQRGLGGRAGMSGGANAGGTPAARAFFAGTCLLCPPEHCTRRESLPCRHPESIRPSLEALGFDVARTTSGLFGIDLQWGRPDTPPAYLTLLSALACSGQQHTRD